MVFTPVRSTFPPFSTAMSVTMAGRPFGPGFDRDVEHALCAASGKGPRRLVVRHRERERTVAEGSPSVEVLVPTEEPATIEIMVVRDDE